MDNKKLPKDEEETLQVQLSFCNLRSKELRIHEVAIRMCAVVFFSSFAGKILLLSLVTKVHKPRIFLVDARRETIDNRCLDW